MNSGKASVQLDGLLGEALDANRRGRLSHFITDEHSPAIALFSPAQRLHNTEGDWYGEHAGKWLVAASRAAARSGDEALRANVLRVADYLLGVQEPDGYLGTYAPERRFMCPQPPRPGTWDGAPGLRTWDIWTHSYLVLGLLEVHRHFPDARYLQAAMRIGDLCWRTLGEQGLDITTMGNHFGLSATVLMEPAVELHLASGEPRYLELARLVLRQAQAQPQSALLTQALAGRDISEIASGKAYQLLWNLVGLAKLHRVDGTPHCLEAVELLWSNVREHHLSLGGGPWGGMGHRSREVFNPAGVFTPHGYVETCSTLAWIELNRELLAITGAARYAEEIERSAYNDLLGAQAPDGQDWCYYSFANGRRVHTTTWRCCKSSGAMAIEELPEIAYVLSPAGDLAVNLFGPGQASFAHPRAGQLTIVQETRYPYAGEVVLRITPELATQFVLRLRIPSWALGATVSVSTACGDGSRLHQPMSAPCGDYACIERLWQSGDEVHARFPMPAQIHRALHRNLQESRAPDGSHVSQEVLRFEYLGISRGPLVLATGLIDGFKIDETLRLPAGPTSEWLRELPPDGDGAPRIALVSGYREPLVFEPYFQAGGRMDGTWRLTWLSLAPAGSAAALDYQ